MFRGEYPLSAKPHRPTKPNRRRQHPSQVHFHLQIAREVFGSDRVDVQEDILEAIATAVNLGESGDESAPATGVVVFGSVLLAGEVLRLMDIRP